MSFSYSVCPKCQKVNKINAETAHEKAPTCGACQTELDYHEGVTNLSGEQVIKLVQSSPLPVVIDFWAPWCGPCRAFAPTFSSTAQDMLGRYVFVKVNTQDYPGIAQAFGVQGIPTVAVFNNGEELDRQSGALPKEHFTQWLQNVSG